ncbi:MAG TPA: ornithine cyclodeaminase family protein [Candidatus Eisenbacteria bacterium]|nr:ornithine cyclodeaminase family protein [Candidatus Eisenbacteria bacterium]
MNVRIVGQSEVPLLLPMRECVTLMAEALQGLARGEAVQPLRSVTPRPDGSGVLGSMPAILGTPRALGVKVITVTPANHGTPFDSHQGAVLLFEAEHGSLVAVIDATSITSIRTAAVSAVATDALARRGVTSAAILGSGVQAATHLEALRVVRPIERVRVWSRTLEHAKAFAARESARHAIRIEAARSAREAVEGAEVVCVATAAREPVLCGEWISPGAHVNAVGACVPTHRELDTAAVRRARLFVDRRESALHEAGDILIPIREGAIGENHIVGEIGEVLLGRLKGRGGDEEITLFKSLGLAIEDVAAAHRIHANAAARGVGLAVDLGGRRDAPA